ncbi:hypothetical protein CVT26_005150, partial [Gymnopilus dilepis]
MSTPSLPSSWGEPRQFAVPLPFDYDPIISRLLVACSATHGVLGLTYSQHVYIYSFPAFDLVHVLGPEEIPNYMDLEIHGEILVVKCSNVTDDPVGGCWLYFWDLAGGMTLGKATLDVDHYYNVGVSAPGTELVEVEEHGELIRDVWPKIPTLIVISPDSLFLRTYTLHHSVAQACPASEDIRGEEIQGSSAMLPVMTIPKIHRVICHASVGRTAITGGQDATVRVWDILTGQCRLVLIGHGSRVINVRIDKARIYSAASSFSSNEAIRVWDRRSGSCLHVLDLLPSQHFTHIELSPSYLVTSTVLNGSQRETFICDPVSGKPNHRISNELESYLGPIRGKEHTLVTWDLADEDPQIALFKIWDVTSGRLLMRSPIGNYSRYRHCWSQDHFLLTVIKQEKEYLLKIWDFRPDGSSEAERNNDQTALEDGITDDTNGPNEEEPRNTIRRQLLHLVIRHTPPFPTELSSPSSAQHRHELFSLPLRRSPSTRKSHSTAKITSSRATSTSYSLSTTAAQHHYHPRALTDWHQNGQLPCNVDVAASDDRRTPSKIPSKRAATPYAPGSGGSSFLSPSPEPTYTALPILALIPLVLSAPSLAFLTASSKAEEVESAPPTSVDDGDEQEKENWDRGAEWHQSVHDRPIAWLGGGVLRERGEGA